MKVRKTNGLTVRLLSTLLFTYSGCAGAGEPSVPAALTLKDAVVLVLERSPQLQAAEYESRAAAARIRQARLTTPWKVDIDLENFAGNGIHSGFDAVEATLSIARVLELGEKPELRGELARQEAVLLQNSQDARRLDLVAETARRFVEVVSRQEFLVITGESVALAQRTLEAVEQRVQAGRTSLAEQRRAGIAVARALLEQEHASHQLDTARQKLVSMWGETRADVFITEAELFTLNPVVDFKLLESLLEHNPDLVLYATEQRVDAARTALARSSQRPDLELAGGVRYLGLVDDAALVFSASIPLGTSKRAANLIEASEQASLASPLIYEQRRLELYSMLYEIYQELQHMVTAVEVFGLQIIPAAEQALEDYENGFAVGRYSLLELTEAQRVLLDARLEYLAAASDFHRSQIEIERLTGAALNTGATP